MHAVLEQLKQAIQHALTLGLGRAGGLEPLRDALRAIEPYDALAPLTESLQRVLETTDARLQLDQLVRLHYACEQCQIRLNLYRLPTLSDGSVREPTRQAAAPSREDPFASLFRGEASLVEVLPAVYEIISAWQPEQPILPLQLTLAHSGIAHVAIEKLQSLGEGARPILIRLAMSKSPMVRLRACELLLDFLDPRATAALRSALPKAPKALPLFQKLRHRPDLQALLVRLHTPSLEQWLDALTTREQLFRSLQNLGPNLMLLPADSPFIEQLVEKARTLARTEVDFWAMIARIPHEQITRALLAENQFTEFGFAHFEATLDYRLTPLILSTIPRFWSGQLYRIRYIADAAFLPYVFYLDRENLSYFGEPAELISSN